MLVQPKSAQGYVNGEPVTLIVASIGSGLYLRADAAAAFLAMRAACFTSIQKNVSPSGPNSAFRTPEQQAFLVNELGAYSETGLAAAVGRSPHQAGIAIDLACLDPAKSNYDSQLANWLVTNCHAFGWNNRGDTFKKKEPWHYEFRPELYT